MDTADIALFKRRFDKLVTEYIKEEKYSFTAGATEESLRKEFVKQFNKARKQIGSVITPEVVKKFDIIINFTREKRQLMLNEVRKLYTEKLFSFGQDDNLVISQIKIAELDRFFNTKQIQLYEVTHVFALSECKRILQENAGSKND